MEEDTASFRRIQLTTGGLRFVQEDTAACRRTQLSVEGYRCRFLRENIVPVKDDNIILVAHVIFYRKSSAY